MDKQLAVSVFLQSSLSVALSFWLLVFVSVCICLSLFCHSFHMHSPVKSHDGDDDPFCKNWGTRERWSRSKHGVVIE